MTVDEPSYLVARYTVELTKALFHDDTIDGVLDRLPPAPELVSSIAPVAFDSAPTRVRSLALECHVHVDAFVAAAASSRRSRDGTIEWVAIPPYDAPEKRGATVTINAVEGDWVESILVERHAGNDLPDEITQAPSFAAAAAEIAPPKQTTSTVSVGEPAETVIGAFEPVPPIPVTEIVSEVLARRLAVLDGRYDVRDLTGMAVHDPDRIYYGSPPQYLPILSVGVDGMTYGFMHDRGEGQLVDTRLALYGFSMDGVALLDFGEPFFRVARQAVHGVRPYRAEALSASDLADWESGALAFLAELGEAGFGSDLPDRLAAGAKRRRPPADKSMKWHTDSSGNGVLAPREAWGSDGYRRPRSHSAALDLAGTSDAPAVALLAAQEALAIANRANSATNAGQAYAAMVEPLERLGRGTIAARAATLAEIGGVS